MSTTSKKRNPTFLENWLKKKKSAAGPVAAEENLNNKPTNAAAATDEHKPANSNAADLLGMPDRGRIMEGAYADILIVNGNPLEDISMVSDPVNHHLVLKNGTPVS